MVRTSSMIIFVLPFRVGQGNADEGVLLFPGFGNFDYRGFWSRTQEE